MELAHSNASPDGDIDSTAKGLEEGVGNGTQSSSTKSPAESDTSSSSAVSDNTHILIAIPHCF